MAGFSDKASIWLAAVTAAAQSVGVCIGIYFIEKCGRRTLALSSLGMVTAALVLLGLGFHLHDAAAADAADANQFPPAAEKYGYVVVGTMIAYLFTFGVGMSSVPWTVNAEIYPNHARSLGTSASTTVNWIGNVAVSATFLTLASDDVLGKAGAFWLYASIAVAGWVWLFWCMPETKGLPLEEIELLFAREGDPRRPGDEVGGGDDGTPRKTHGVADLSGNGGDSRSRRTGDGFTLLREDEDGGSGGSASPSRQSAGAGAAAADWIDAGGSEGSSKMA